MCGRQGECSYPEVTEEGALERLNEIQMTYPSSRRQRLLQAWIQNARVQIPSMLLTSSVTVSKGPSFPYFVKQGKARSAGIRLLQELNKIMHVTCLGQCLEQRKRLINVTYYCNWGVWVRKRV